MKKFNYSNLKNKTWDIKIINYLTQIHEEKGKQQLFLKQKHEELEKLVIISLSMQLSIIIFITFSIDSCSSGSFPITSFFVIGIIQ